MTEVLVVFEQMSPLLRRCQNDGWLAVAPDEFPVHIGVFAWSAEDARNQFAQARAEWCILLERALREPVRDSRPQ
jgi:hypothetical protein